MAGDGLVTVEFYGVPRQRAGRAELAVRAGRVADVLASVERECPALRGLLLPDGSLARHYLLSVDGGRFLKDTAERVKPGEHILLLSADAGG